MEKTHKIILLLAIGVAGGFGVVQSCGDDDFTEPTKTVVHDDQGATIRVNPEFPDPAVYMGCPTTGTPLAPTAGPETEGPAGVRVINTTDHPVMIALGDEKPVELLAGVNWPLGMGESFQKVDGGEIALNVSYGEFSYSRALTVHTGWDYTLYVTHQAEKGGDRCLSAGAYASRDDDPYLVRVTNASPTLGTTDVHIVADGRIHARFDGLKSMETSRPFDAVLAGGVTVELGRPSAATLIYDLGELNERTDVLIAGDAASRDGLELLLVNGDGTTKVDAQYGWAAVHLATENAEESQFSFCDAEGVCCRAEAGFASRSTWSACEGPRVTWLLGDVQDPVAKGALELNGDETSRAFVFHMKDGEPVATSLPLLTHVASGDETDSRFARLIHAADETPLTLETFTGTVKGDHTVRVDAAGGVSEVFVRGDSVFVQQGSERVRLDLTQVAATYVDLFVWREREQLRAAWRPSSVAGELIRLGATKAGEACDGATCADGSVCITEKSGESACREFCDGACGNGETCAPVESELWLGATACRPGVVLEGDLRRDDRGLSGRLTLKAEKPMNFDFPALLSDGRTVRWYRPGLVADIELFDENGTARTSAMVTLRTTRQEQYATNVGPVSGGGTIIVREKGGEWFFDGGVGMPAVTNPAY